MSVAAAARPDRLVRTGRDAALVAVGAVLLGRPR
jgi:hypothetical protein